MNKRLKEIFDTNALVLVAAALISIYFIVNTVSVLQRNHELQQEIIALDEEVSLLQIENENLKLANEYYKTDEYLELEARRELNKVASGESVLILPEQEQQSEQQDDANESSELDKPQYQKNIDSWLFFLFKRQPS